MNFWETLKSKLTSRKFIIAVSGFISGVIIAASGNVTEGVYTIIGSVVGYLIAEGYIDGKKIKQQTEEILDEIEK